MSAFFDFSITQSAILPEATHGRFPGRTRKARRGERAGTSGVTLSRILHSLLLGTQSLLLQQHNLFGSALIVGGSGDQVAQETGFE